jgi:protoporphyrinogen/coproporphyrinogen III oxidase
MSAAPHIVVVGGGVTGLTAAYHVAQAARGVRVTVLEARDRLGGNIVTERRDGFLLDGGPDAFLRTKPHAVQLIEELGLAGQLITTSARKVYVAHHGQLEPMPGGMALAVPTRLGPMLKTPLLSWPGKLRMLGDLVLPRGRASSDRDESIADFLSRRFGEEAVERLAGPLLGGIYAGNVRELSIQATFPQLVELEQRHGSLVRGLFAAQRARVGSSGGAPTLRDLLGWLRRQEEEAPSPFYSLRDGLGQLIEALAAALPEGCVRTRAPVRRLEREACGWAIELDGAEVIQADAVLLACPAHVATRLVPDEALSSELAAIPYVSTATVFLGLRLSGVSRDVDGVGFIVPRGEGKILAGTWVSSKWEGRAPDDGVLVRAFVGGARGEVDVSRAEDAELVELVRTEMERLMGPLGSPLFSRVFRYVDSNPQPVVGHPARLRRIAERLKRFPGLAVAGAPYDGVGIPDCVRQARDAAERLLDMLSPGADP